MSGLHERVVSEIGDHLDRLAKRGEPWVATWVASAICGDHDVLPANEDGEFWRWNGYQNVRNLVRKQINKRAGDKADRAHSHQLVLHGFDRDYLQDYYMVERDGKEIGVPVTTMSDDELDAKAGLHRAMGAAHYGHADELERFKWWRQNVAEAV